MGEMEGPADGVLGEGRIVYLDNAATTRVYPQVRAVMADAFENAFGNPSSAHCVGRRAKRLMEESRETLAGLVGAHPDEIYFTSGGTESNNLAITGASLAFERVEGAGTVITSALEHPSVTKTVRNLRRSGWRTEHLDAVGGDLDLASLEQLLAECDDVALVSVMSVQSELGYRFPIADVAALCREKGGDAHGGARPLVHTDAVQAFGKLDVDVEGLGVDLMSFCSHKIGGPKGIGALYVRRGTSMFTTAAGGGQESGLRSGTQAVPLIAGFAEAARITCEQREASFAHVSSLKREILDGLAEHFEGLRVNARDDGSPYIVSFSIPGTSNTQVIRALDERGICISASTACATSRADVPAGTWRAKHPLTLRLAGFPASWLRCTYRVSLCKDTTAEDVRVFLEAFTAAADRSLAGR